MRFVWVTMAMPRSSSEKHRVPLRIYVREAKTQAEFAKWSYAAFRKAEKNGLVHEIFFHLHHFVVHVTNIDRIVDASAGSRRSAILASRLDLSGVDLRTFRKLRNHLEHFDERLDRWVRDFDGHAFFDMNIVTGSKVFPKKAFLRATGGDTFKFFGESYNMTQLYCVMIEIDRRLAIGCS